MPTDPKGTSRREADSGRRGLTARLRQGKPKPRGGTARDPHWDNVRLVSGTLVLVGHLIEPLGTVDGLRWVYVTSWAMRVPVFVIVAGYFSSAGPLSARELRRLTESVLAPYLLISLLHTLQLKLLYGDWTFFVGDPAWGLWFLLSLFVWRLLLPYLAVLRWPLPLSMLASLAVGYMGSFGATFSASRTLAFLPFFVLGWQLRQGHARSAGVTDELLHARWTRWAAVGVLAVTAAAGWVFRYRIDTAWLAMRAPYADSVPLEPEWAWGLRGMVLVCGMVIALSFIRLVPKRQLPVVTYLGAGGLYIYLLHPLLLRALTAVWDVTSVGPWPEQLALLALGVTLAAALGSPPVRRLTRPVVQPRLPWLYAREPEPLKGARGTARTTTTHPEPATRV
ncbi:acyltransferase family protein [Streptomyces sp. HNM0574]|uniref:acyltransferase family protein n=1 Tax=Streptomyces sp. HNM0574 TaxID=2714954 RepID=UPI00146C4615|nr:acyltransferase family protein [Streptomyces sp. HNM0574]NLU70886.1 acyltransferase family protein [Streptomyces sp. HNM0574]